MVVVVQIGATETSRADGNLKFRTCWRRKAPSFLLSTVNLIGRVTCGGEAVYNSEVFRPVKDQCLYRRRHVGIDCLEIVRTLTTTWVGDSNPKNPLSNLIGGES